MRSGTVARRQRGEGVGPGIGATASVTTIGFTSTLDVRAAFSVTLYRESATGAVVEQSVVRVTLEARETRTVDVALTDASHAPQVAKCRIDAPVRGADTTGGGPGTPKVTPKTTDKATATAPAAPKATPRVTGKAGPKASPSR
ncbi:hypothetical protein ACFV9E_18940 [Streptomyces sp. NPDC059835]|uniref:hypothetical protein n=1 Tax=Streptomyces sp. NPDC059835 TaxID=3346967 RepID=UPI003669F9B1